MMNERIKELMLQAFQEHYGDPVTPGAREKALELVSGWGDKFAELMVKECAKVVDDKLEFTSSMGPDNWASGDDLLEHFGVK